jgi:Cu+-exporting ATPase
MWEVNMSAVVTEIRARRPDATTQQPVQREHVELRIGGMACAHCPPAIEKAAAAVPGVISASVNPSTKVARIDYHSARTKITDILHAVRSVGYTVGTATMRVPIKNMHCGSCLMRIELALQMVPGVVSARASLETNAADIEYQPERVDFSAVRKAIESAGYHAAKPKIEPTAEVLDPAEAANEQEYRTLMRKFWFAAAISIPVMAPSYLIWCRACATGCRWEAKPAASSGVFWVSSACR